MSWYERNAANLLRLRLLKINGQWNDYWAKRKTEELSRKNRCFHYKKECINYIYNGR